MKYSIKKFNIEKSKKNIIVKVTFFEEKYKCSCVGVLLRQDEDEIKIGFNAKDNIVIDSLIISTKNIIRIDELDIKSIPVLK